MSEQGKIERQRRVMALLDELLALPASERSDRLARTTGEERELADEVAALLAQAEADDHVGFLEQPLFSIHDDDDLAVGPPIGPFQPRRLLGRGGMGVVYLAERGDSIGQQVALKVIKHGLESDEIVRRFQSERRILACLRHHHIARLLDGGTTSDGRPWFAMEYVEGEPIDHYCERQQLPIRRRLQLFLKVCEAVQIAHQSLVVHRDLKPANILVDAVGEPWLLDFGIAKLLQPDGSIQDRGHDLTAPGRPLLTPAYASPEQVRGEPVTTAGDVYSLGVLLYRLLCGRQPYRIDGLSPAQAERVICEQEPPRPSTVAKERRLAGDLDSIVFKALRKEPQHRYSSVAQLAHDLTCHLDGRPVTAASGTFFYRAAKFIRRNRVQLVATVLLGLVLGFLTTMVLQRQRLAREQQAKQRLAVVLDTLLETVQPSTSRPEKAEIRQALLAVAATLDEVYADTSEQAPELARLLDKLGRAFRSHGLYDDARPLLRRALELRRRHLGDHHPQVADSLNNLGFLEQQAGDLPAAEELLRQSIDIKRQRWGDNDPRLATSLNNLAMVLRDMARYHEAEQLFRQVLAWKRSLYGPGSSKLIGTGNNLAAVLVDLGRYLEAVEIYRSGLASRLQRYGPQHRLVSLSRNSLARALFHQGKLSEAAALYRQDLESRLLIYGKMSPEVARVRTSLGVVLQEQGAVQAAEQELRAALQIQLDHLDPDHGDIAATRRSLAVLLAESDRAAEGEQLARDALTTLRNTQSSGSWLIAYAKGVLGGCLVRQARYPEAEPLLQNSYTALRKSRGEHSPYTQKVKTWLAALEQRQ